MQGPNNKILTIKFSSNGILTVGVATYRIKQLKKNSKLRYIIAGSVYLYLIYSINFKDIYIRQKLFGKENHYMYST